MYIFNPTEVEYWEKYFILQMLPTPEERVEVDISSGTREHFVIMSMRKEGHLFVDGDEDNIIGIASTKQGVNFHAYLIRIGHGGNTESEEKGRMIVKGMENAFYGLSNDEVDKYFEGEDKDEDFDDHADDEIDDNDLSQLYDPFFGTAARLIVALGYSIEKLKVVLCFEDDRFDKMIRNLIDGGFIDEYGKPLVSENGLERVLEKFNLG